MVPTGARWERKAYRRPSGPKIEPLLRARSDDPTETNFLYNSYLKSFRKQHPQFWIPHALYFKPQAQTMAWLLGNAECLIACFPEDPTELLGYALFHRQPDALVLHYMYTKLHGRGIGRQLLAAAAEDRTFVVVTHMCDDFSALRNKAAPLRMVYDPFALERMMHHG